MSQKKKHRERFNPLQVRTHHRSRPRIEPVEDRLLLTTYTAQNVTQLIADINTANSATTPTEIDLVKNTTYSLTSTSTISSTLPAILNTQGLNIVGNGATISRNLSSTKNFALLDMKGGSLTISNLTLSGGQNQGSAGGLVVEGGTTTLTGVTVSGNQDIGTGSAAANGGGITVTGGVLNLNQSKVAGNTASGGSSGPQSGYGGGIANLKGTLNIVGGSVTSNYANGGIGASSSGSSGGTGAGGGIYISGGSVAISGGALINNNTAIGGAGASGAVGGTGASGAAGQAGGGGSAGGAGGKGQGGGLYVANAANVTFFNSSLSANSVYGNDGGNGGKGGKGGHGKGTFLGDLGSGGSGGAGGAGASGAAGYGGGLYLGSGSVTFYQATIATNHAEGGRAGQGGTGGAGGSAKHRNGGVGGNGGKSGSGGTAYGGGLYTAVGSTTSIVLDDSTLASNTVEGGNLVAGGPGGQGGTNATKHRNQNINGSVGSSGAGGNAVGGGLYNGSGVVTLTNATIAFNATTAGSVGQFNAGAGYGGGVMNVVGTVTAGNSLIAKNTVGTTAANFGPDYSGMITSKGNNLVGINDSTNGLVSSDRSGVLSQPLDPRIGTLGNNGGSPQQTIPLLAGSPAINGGSNALALDPSGAALTTDQRGAGYPRINVGTVDIGAFESTLSPAGTPTATAQTINVAHNTGSSAATAITLSGSDPDSPALPLTYTITARPQHGQLNGTAPKLTYIPTANYHGADSFAFTVNNGVNTSTAATVSLNVAAGSPVATSSLVYVRYNTATSITLGGYDSDSPSLPLTYAVSSQPTHGKLTGSATKLVYTPTTGFTGTDSFSYTISNGTNTTAPTKVSLDLVSPNLLLAPPSNSSGPTPGESDPGESAPAEFADETDPSFESLPTDGTSPTPVVMVPVVALTAPPVTSITAGSAYAATASFTDTAAGPYSVLVNYGDNTASVPMTLDAAGAIPLAHAYPRPGVYAVQVLVVDSSGGADLELTAVQVGQAVPGSGLGAAKGAFTTTLYRDLLGRVPTGPELTQVDQGLTRPAAYPQAATTLARGVEYRQLQTTHKGTGISVLTAYRAAIQAKDKAAGTTTAVKHVTAKAVAAPAVVKHITAKAAVPHVTARR